MSRPGAGHSGDPTPPGAAPARTPGTGAAGHSGRVVVVGASAGGVESLMALARGLPLGFPAPILVVLHAAPAAPSFLPQILCRAGPLHAAHAQDGEPLTPGHIYVAPPDHHLLVEDGRVAVTRGPKENRFRPSVDTLFRSAAYVYGPAAIGVILSGLLDDGTSGLWAVGRRGGVTVVQDPADALFRDMPESALRQVRVDHVVPAAGLGTLLTGLARAEVPAAPEEGMDDREFRRLQTEVRIAAEDGALEEGVMGLGELSPLACPDCHGTLTQIREGGAVRYRCHTGHAFTGNTLLMGVTGAVEDNLWKAVRALEESVMLLRQMGEHYAGVGEGAVAEGYLDRAHEAEARAQAVRALALGSPRLSADLIRGEVRDQADP